jgi:predicted phosphodiesterase
MESNGHRLAHELEKPTPMITPLDIADGPLLVFGGPYSNLQATRALIQRAKDLGVPPERAICTGDAVAYGGDPQATVDAIRTWGCHIIAGNCEQQLGADADDCGCGFDEGSSCDRLSKGWYPFAKARIDADSRAWMRSLPTSLRLRWQKWSIDVVHGTADETSRFVFASETQMLDKLLSDTGADIVLAGHAGLPFIHRAASGQAWVNAGVIGIPANDGTGETWFGLLTPRHGSIDISLHRLAYDHEAAAACMRKSGHADAYALTLCNGLWPSLDVLPLTERNQTGRPLRLAPQTLSRRRAMSL